MAGASENLTAVLFSVPAEHQEDFYDLLIEFGSSPEYLALGVNIKHMSTPLVEGTEPTPDPCEMCAHWDADLERCAELCRHNPDLTDCYEHDGLETEGGS